MKRQTYLEELAEQMGPRTAIGRQVARKRARAAAKPKRPATLPPELTAPLDAKPGLVVGDGMMAKATAMLARANAGQRTPTPFDLAPAHWHPPGVVPPNTKLAMDEAVVGFSDWAAGAWGQNVVQSMFWEGQEFLGYPYLSVLGQRAEYRAIVETIATESMRKGYKVQAADPELDKTDRIRELTDYMANHLKVQEHFKLASAQDGYFGRAHLFIDTGESDDRDEMRLPIGDGNDALSRGKVTPKLQKTLALRNIEPVWCYPNNYNSNDPFKADWYNPQTWYGLGKETHKTRLLLFVGNPVSDLLKPAYSFGGLSMTQMAKPYVDNWLRIRQSVADIVQAFSVMVLSTDLSASLATDGQAMIQRAVVFNALRANNGLFMVNKDTEEFTNVAAPLGTLDQLQAQAQEHMCAVSKIPTVKLLGIQPAGLNADSEGIMRAFYDSIAAYQESFHRPNMTKVFHFAQLALWGEVDEALVLVFDPLFTLDEKGKAEVEKIELETDVIGVDSGILHPEEARKRIASNPDSPYQGLDVENVPEPPAEPGTEGEGGGTPEEGGGELEPTKVKSSINVAGGDEGVAEDGVLPFDASTEFVESEHPRSPDGKFGSGGGALKMADLKKVGKQMGSNPGGVYEDAAGKKFYVKQGQTKAHVDNELAAARLYRMASVPTLQYRPVEGGAHIATEMAKLDKDNAKKLSPAEVKEAQRDFAVHAWLSNWDVVGLGGDNLGVVGGKPTPLDMGGALAFRAQGSPKGGKFGDTVGEVDTLRSKQMNPDAAGVFGSMSEKDMRESARRVTDIPDEKIHQAAEDATLGDKLVARKQDLAKRFKLHTHEEQVAWKAKQETARQARLPKSEGDPATKDSVVVIDGDPPVKELNGVAFKPWTPPADWSTVDGQADIEESAFDVPKGKRAASGVVVQEPDGRVWLMRPTLGYGGYDHSFPKGGMEKGLSPQANAIKEAWEETGLKVRIKSMVGDHEGDTSMTRYYLAERVDGTPAQAGPESEAVVLAPRAKLDKFLNRSRDRKVVEGLGGDEAPFEEGKHPRDPDGKFSSGGGAPPALKHFKASPNKAEHQHAVHKITTSPAKKSHTYRWTLNKYIEEAKAFGAATQPLKDKLAQSWGLVLMDLQAKGDDATAKKVLKKIIDLKGAQAAAEQLKAPSPKPAEQPKPAPPPPQMSDVDQVLKFSPKFVAAYGGLKSTWDTLEHAKDVVKVAVQQGDASVEAVKVMLTDKEKNLLAKQYGSVEKTYKKAQAYHAAKQEQEKSQAEQQAKAQATAKAEADKLAAEMNDPAVKEHYDVLKGIGVGKYAKDTWKSAQAIIKANNLAITPQEGAYIIAYRGKHYEAVNEQLRQGVAALEQWKFASELDKALDKMPTYEGNVERGVSFKKAEHFERYKNAVGKVVIEPGFQSSGVKSKLWGDHTFKIKSKTGRDIRAFNPGEGGGEVVFKNNTAFLVTKVDGMTIHMEEV